MVCSEQLCEGAARKPVTPEGHTEQRLVSNIRSRKKVKPHRMQRRTHQRSKGTAGTGHWPRSNQSIDFLKKKVEGQLWLKTHLFINSRDKPGTRQAGSPGQKLRVTPSQGHTPKASVHGQPP